MNNTNSNVDVVETTGDGAVENSATTNSTETNQESVTMSRIEYDKAIQSAEDRVRGKMSKQIKELEAKVKELTPIQKTQAEIDLEERIARLEASEREVADKKRKLEMQERLTAKGMNHSIADFLKDDVDVEALSTVINDMVKSHVKSNGFIPGEHSSDEKITPEEFRKMSYSQKEKFSREHPESYKRLRKMK